MESIDRKETEGMEKEKEEKNARGERWAWLKKVMVVFLFLLSVMQPVQTAQASSAIGTVPEFDYLSGDARYLGQMYRNNYHLDMEEAGLLDVGYIVLNMLVNILFNFIWFTAFLTVTLFYICFDLNLAQMFGSQIDVIQSALNDSVFQPLFLLGCAGAFCVLLMRMWKQDLAGVLGQILKIIGIVMVSVLVLTHSDVVLTYCTGITKEISIGMLTGINEADSFSSSVDEFAAQAAGILWQNLIHEPWKSLEFDTAPATGEDIEAFLSTSPGSEERTALVAARDWKCFKKEQSVERAGFILLYLAPFLLKCGIYLVVAVLQLVFQLLAIFYVFMAPLILIIALFPNYEKVLGIWVRKIVESQISILVLTLMIGILIQFDKIIFEWSRTSQRGWLIALAIQTALAIGLFYNKDKLLHFLSNVQHGISTPGFAANRLRMSGNIYQDAVPETITYGRKLERLAGETIKRNTAKLWKNLEEGEKRKAAAPETSKFKQYSADGWETAGDREDDSQTAENWFFWTWDPTKQERIQETKTLLPENNMTKTPKSPGPSTASAPEPAFVERPAFYLCEPVMESTYLEGSSQVKNNQELPQDLYTAVKRELFSQQKESMKRQNPERINRIHAAALSQEEIPEQANRNRKVQMSYELQQNTANVKPVAKVPIRLSDASVQGEYSIKETAPLRKPSSKSATETSADVMVKKDEESNLCQDVQKNRKISTTRTQAENPAIKNTVNTQQKFYQPVLVQPDNRQKEKEPLSVDMVVHINTEKDKTEQNKQLRPGEPKSVMEFEIKPLSAARENKRLPEERSKSGQYHKPEMVIRQSSEREHKAEQPSLLSLPASAKEQKKIHSSVPASISEEIYAVKGIRSQENKRSEKIYEGIPVLKQPKMNSVPAVPHSTGQAYMTNTFSQPERRKGSKESLRLENESLLKTMTQNHSVEPIKIQIEGEERTMEIADPKKKLKTSILPQLNDPDVQFASSHSASKILQEEPYHHVDRAYNKVPVQHVEKVKETESEFNKRLNPEPSVLKEVPKEKKLKVQKSRTKKERLESKSDEAR